MQVDVRGLRGKEPLLRVREVLASLCTDDERLEVLVSDQKEAKRVGAFLAMSGCKVEFHRQAEHWVVSMVGRTCRCG
jgi:TusA-related sulfurtransferase